MIWVPTDANRAALIEQQRTDDRHRENLCALYAEDVSSQMQRAERSALFEQLYPPDAIRLWGGAESLAIYRELRLAFLNGMHRAVIALAASCAKRELGAKLSRRGVQDVAEFRMESLLSMASALDEISLELKSRLSELTKKREENDSFHSAAAVLDHGNPIDRQTTIEHALRPLAELLSKRRT